LQLRQLRRHVRRLPVAAESALLLAAVGHSPGGGICRTGLLARHGGLGLAFAAAAHLHLPDLHTITWSDASVPLALREVSLQ